MSQQTQRESARNKGKNFAAPEEPIDPSVSPTILVAVSLLILRNSSNSGSSTWVMVYAAAESLLMLLKVDEEERSSAFLRNP